MEEVRYMISEAANLIDVEAHVLRNWQKELALPISRNEMDQRYYKPADIELLKKLKELREYGFQLKAIKMVLSTLDSPYSLDLEAILQQKEDNKMTNLIQEDELEDKLENEPGDDLEDEQEATSLITEEDTTITEESESKMGQFQALMKHIIMSALKENNARLVEDIGVDVTNGVVSRMSYLMKVQEEKEEERFRKFDASIREFQKSRMMAAATIDKKKKRSKFAKKNRIYI
ncbi:MAG: MerR family transcriptional regulator [Mobilitalea sp.]